MYEPDLAVATPTSSLALRNSLRRDSVTTQDDILGFCIDMADCMDVDLLEPVYDSSLPVLPGQKYVEPLSAATPPPSATLASLESKVPVGPLSSMAILGETKRSSTTSPRSASGIDTMPFTSSEQSTGSSSSSSSSWSGIDDRGLAQFNSGVLDPDSSFGSGGDDFVIVPPSDSYDTGDVATAHSSTMALSEAAAAELAAVQATIAASKGSSSTFESSPPRSYPATRRVKSTEIVCELTLKPGFRNRFAMDAMMTSPPPTDPNARPVTVYFIGERNALTVLVDWLRLSISVYEEQTAAERVRAATSAATTAATVVPSSSPTPSNESASPPPLSPSSVGSASSPAPSTAIAVPVTRESYTHVDPLDPKQAIFIKGRSEIAYFPELVEVLSSSLPLFGYICVDLLCLCLLYIYDRH
jgi:hypothetical protein